MAGNFSFRHGVQLAVNITFLLDMNQAKAPRSAVRIRPWFRPVAVPKQPMVCVAEVQSAPHSFSVARAGFQRFPRQRSILDKTLVHSLECSIARSPIACRTRRALAIQLSSVGHARARGPSRHRAPRGSSNLRSSCTTTPFWPSCKVHVAIPSIFCPGCRTCRS